MSPERIVPVVAPASSSVSTSSRRQLRFERVTAHHIQRLDLDAEPSAPTTPALDRASNPRNPPSSLSPDINCTPSIDVSAIEIKVIVGFGGKFAKLLDLGTVETALGRASTIEQLQGLITNDAGFHEKLKMYDIKPPADHGSTSISFTDAAGERHEIAFETRWQSAFGIWVGEVESGSLGAPLFCYCDACDGTHGPEIRIFLNEERISEVAE